MSTDLECRIGRRLRARRRLLNLSQSELALACGVTFQQIQKYEAGMVTISAARLWSLAHALDVPIMNFFDGLPGDRGALRRPSPPLHAGLDVDQAAPPGRS
jgi:transcriptional regulator with XRE-family HTH domain